MPVGDAVLLRLVQVRQDAERGFIRHLRWPGHALAQVRHVVGDVAASLAGAPGEHAHQREEVRLADLRQGSAVSSGWRDAHEGVLAAGTHGRVEVLGHRPLEQLGCRRLDVPGLGEPEVAAQPVELDAEEDLRRAALLNPEPLAEVGGA